MKNYTTFKSPYILIEDSKARFQPIYKEYANEIPSINLESPILCCPFSNARRSNKPKKKNNVKSGYCEICYMRYEDYAVHVESKDHREYAEDDYNYREIDIFIKEFIEQELYGMQGYINSPCEQLEAKYAGRQLIHYSSDGDFGSLIRVSIGSCDDQENIVDFDVILDKISQKTGGKYNKND